MLKSRRVAILTLLVILAATAVPTDLGGGGSGLCILCGGRGLADFILNVGLYAPLGAALAALGWRWGRATGAGALLSLGIEFLQILVIAGRDASLGDLVSNTAGVALGWTAWWAWVGQRRAGPNVAALLPSLAALLFSGLLLVGLWLLTPSFPQSTYYLQWTPDLGRMEVYQGRVLSSRIGALELPGPPGPIQRTDSVRTLLRRGAAVEAVVLVGAPSSGLAPVFSIYDEQRREVLLLGADGKDLVYRWHTKAKRLRLDRTEVRFTGLLDGLQPGDTATLAVSPRGGAGPGSRGYCARSGRTETCRPGLAADQTWTLLFYGRGWETRLRRMLGFIWLAAAFLPAGLLGRRWSDRGLAAVIAVLGLTAMPILLGFSPTPPGAVVAAIAGIGLGATVSRSAPDRESDSASA